MGHPCFFKVLLNQLFYAARTNPLFELGQEKVGILAIVSDTHIVFDRSAGFVVEGDASLLSPLAQYRDRANKSWFF